MEHPEYVIYAQHACHEGVLSRFHWRRLLVLLRLHQRQDIPQSQVILMPPYYTNNVSQFSRDH